MKGGLAKVFAATGVVAVAATAAVVMLGGNSNPASSPPPECRSFQGGIVQAASWSEGGDFVAALVQGREGQSSVSVFSWPDMQVRSQSATGTYWADNVAIDGTGAVYWLSSDPMSPVTESTVWRKSLGAPAEALGVVVGAYTFLLWGDGLLAEHVLDTDRRRLVRLDLSNLGAPIAIGGPEVNQQWVDRSGQWLVRTEHQEVGAQADVVVRHDGVEQRWKLPGYGGRAASITPDHKGVIYQRSETARFTLLDLASGQLLGELDERQFYGGEISSRGIFAGLTAHGPGEPNQLCVFDVNARLAALAGGSGLPEALPTTSPEDIGRRDAFVRALRAAGPRGSVPLRAVLPGDWWVMNVFKPHFDNVTAANTLGFDFDFEGAVDSLGDRQGVIVTLDDGRQVVAWFALPEQLVDTDSVAGGGFGVGECLSVGVRDGRPSLTGIASC